MVFNDKIGIYDKICDENWTGTDFMHMITEDKIPEYVGGGFFPHIHNCKGRENPEHWEDLAEHITQTIDNTISISNEFELSLDDKIILVTVATWHDVGKLICRTYKTAHICIKCGMPNYNNQSNYVGSCDRCSGTTELVNIVEYPEHAEVAASSWLWGRIAKREQIPQDQSIRIGDIIKDHSKVHGNINNGKYEADVLKILFCWADERSRINPIHFLEDGLLGKREQLFNNAYEKLKKEFEGEEEQTGGFNPAYGSEAAQRQARDDAH